MLIRVFETEVHGGKADEFKEFFLNTALPMVKSYEGLVDAIVGLPHASSPLDFSMITVWRDLAALKAFAGDDWRHAVIHPDEKHLIKTVRVVHYETPVTIGAGRSGA